MSQTIPVAHPGSRLRVMLLDDDPFMLELLHAMFDELGSFDVQRESDARRALRALPVEAPDLLVCDLSLPEMDGIEFMQAAARTGFPGAVLLVSGLDRSVRSAAERLAMAHGLRVLGSFAKPLSLASLRSVVEPLEAVRQFRGQPGGAPGQ
ncbi:MAG TPA: response regulator [Telluria sp.]